MYEERLPPHDTHAEEAVIGSLLIDGEAMSSIAPMVTAEDFYRERNRWCFEACFGLYDRTVAIDQVSVAEELVRNDRLEAIGGPAYLSHLVSAVPTSVHVEHYARIVHRLAMMRRIIESAGDIASIGYEAGPDEDQALSRAEDLLFRLRRGQSSRDFVHIREVLGGYLEESGFGPKAQSGRVAMVETGFRRLDNLLGGLHRSDMIVLAARPSLGKSSLALNIARHAAMGQGAQVAIFSLEMGKEQLVQRLLSCESGVDTQRLRLGQFGSVDEQMIIEATGKLAEAPIYIDDSPFMSIVELRSKARRLHMERGVDLVIVDYIGLMLERTEYRVQEMSEISRSLKGLARDLDIPLLAISQLSRAPEVRPNHRPLLSDLRESGSIEQDADVVMFIYRDDFYYTEDEWNKSHPDMIYPKGIADIIVGKHRHGPTDTIQLRFRDSLAKFEPIPVAAA
ncbi:MAG: replicative DNA helicase [Dehalococcoidia bacterium]